MQEQSGVNDAQEFSDLIADFNSRVEARSRHTRKTWLFTLIRAAKELSEIIEKPFSSLFGAALEIADTAAEEEETPAGPLAMFHHIQKNVLDPAGG